jgi:hypothetical protein
MFSDGLASKPAMTVFTGLTSKPMATIFSSLDCGLRGDDGEDLVTVDLFGAFGAVDGDDDVRLATPSSTDENRRHWF